MTPTAEKGTRPWLLRWAVLGLIVAGAVVQIALSVYGRGDHRDSH
ncbi:hypothetical protein [Streptomyces ureilyticus]|nr:hypothetical protein [Streptomyces ureilyticus]